MNTNRVILHIDTSVTKEVVISIDIHGKISSQRVVSDVKRAQALLPLIESMLSIHRFKISDITEITVATGPGSFTGIRVGLSVANALGVLLNIPINGKKTLAAPTYS